MSGGFVNGARRLLLPLTPAYWAATRIKNQLYDGGFFDQLKIPAAVISIGNLSVGGTGKTPVTLHLSKTFARGFRRPVIVTRSYKSRLRHPMAVQLGSSGGPAFYGDEAYELALRAGALVYTGPVKWKTALQAYIDVKPDLILIDDGFQHRRLYRDADVVLVDATDLETTLLPGGRLRETFASLGRADAVILTKVNLAPDGQVQKLRQLIEASIRPGTPFLEASFEIAGPDQLREQAFGKPVALVSALARNEVFKSQCEKILGRPVDQVFEKPDHHGWNKKDIAPIHAWLQQHPGALMLTTEKDEAKLRPFFRTQNKPVALQLEVSLGDGQARLFAHLRSLIDSRKIAAEQLSPLNSNRPTLESGPWPF